MHFIPRGCVVFLAIIAPLAGDGIIPPLDSKQAPQARKIIQDFKSNPKGPYLQIRWFCNDGSVQPPAGTPCKLLGGGVQYAELSPAARRLPSSIPSRDPKFQPLRAKIHSQPGPEDLAAVERFITERKADDPELRELADLLRQQYASAPETRLAPFQKKLARTPIAAVLNEYIAQTQQGKGPANGPVLTIEILRQVTAAGEPRVKLDMLDLNALVLERAFRSGQKPAEQMSRRQQLAGLLEYMSYATGAGLLSLRELAALRTEADALNHEKEVPASRYLQSIRYLERSAGWCRAAAARDSGPVSRHYQEVEPLAGGLVDHLLRGSVALPLTARLEILVADANRAAGIRHSIFGDPSNRGIVGLNPGVAIGRLGILSTTKEKTVDPKRIYVIPQTLADLEPMAGILTLDSGNVLSHSQLLAANLGIPNATVPSALLPVLREKGDVELFFAVTRGGVVILKEKASVAPEEIERWEGRTSANRVRVAINTGKLRLTDTRLIPLTELTAQDAGARAGPKAANLGQLTHFFPENVAPGLVIPFGIYYEHIHRSIDDGPLLDAQIARMYRRAEEMRDSGVPSADVKIGRASCRESGWS